MLCNLHSMEMLPGVQKEPTAFQFVPVASYPNTGYWAPLKRAWFCPLFSLVSGIYERWWNPLKPPLFQGEQSQLSASPHGRNASVPSSLGLLQDSLQYVKGSPLPAGPRTGLITLAVASLMLNRENSIRLLGANLRSFKDHLENEPC